MPQILLIVSIVLVITNSYLHSSGNSNLPGGLILGTTILASLNYSYPPGAILLIVLHVLLYNFFQFLKENNDTQESPSLRTNRTILWLVAALVWSIQVYTSEYEKKLLFINFHRRVRNYNKLKSILDILVPSIVRDKIRQNQKTFVEPEQEVSLVYFDISKFD